MHDHERDDDEHDVDSQRAERGEIAFERKGGIVEPVLENGKQERQPIVRPSTRGVAVQLALPCQTEEHAHDHAVGHMAGHREDRAHDRDLQPAVEHVEHVLERCEAERRGNRIHDCVEHVVECRVLTHGKQAGVLARLLDCRDTDEVLDDDEQWTCRDNGLEQAYQHAFYESGNDSRHRTEQEHAHDEPYRLLVRLVLMVYVDQKRDGRQQRHEQQETHASPFSKSGHIVQQTTITIRPAWRKPRRRATPRHAPLRASREDQGYVGCSTRGSGR